MIFITGDIHGDPRRLSMDSFYEQKEMQNQENNFVIICGDFGLIWNREEESKEEKYWLNWLEDKKFTTLFVDGNHENHTRLASYPVKEWNGGKVHIIRPHVLHLMRGEIFTIEDKKFFTFGGASSHDISDGILDVDDPEWKDKAKDLDKLGRYMYRIKSLSWWEEEMPSKQEMSIGLMNLSKHNNQVDFIITHSPSASAIALLGQGLYKQDNLTLYLEDVKNNIEYKKMFCGHMHINKQINEKDVILYEQIIRIV